MKTHEKGKSNILAIKAQGVAKFQGKLHKYERKEGSVFALSFTGSYLLDGSTSIQGKQESRQALERSNVLPTCPPATCKDFPVGFRAC